MSTLGLTSLEVLVSFCLSVLVVITLMHIVFVAERTKIEATNTMNELFMEQNLARVLHEDADASKTGAFSGTTLFLTRYDNTEYRYDLNTNGELVRYGLTGGGTAVIALGILQFSGKQDGSFLTLDVTFTSGAKETFSMALNGG